MTKQQIEFLTSWMEWEVETQHEVLDKCTSCGGWGDHGFEEETGFLYTCHACFGTGQYDARSLAQ